MSDQKTNAAAGKAGLGMIPQRALIGPARVFGYGARKYAPGNFHTATLDDGAGQRYVSAALRHLAEMQEANGLHTPSSLAALDPESGLPHLDHVICGMLMLRAIMVKSGALETDPGVGLDPAAPVTRVTRIAGVERKCADGRPGCNVPIAHDHASNPSPPRTDFLDTPPRRSSPSSAGLDAAAKAGLW